MTSTERKSLVWFGAIAALFAFLLAIKSILLPFVLGIFTAYFLDPAADRLQKAGLPRTGATLVITVFFFLCLALLLLLVVPLVAHQLSGLLSALPDYIGRFQNDIAPQLSRWLGALSDGQMDSIKSATANFSGVMMNGLANFATGVFESGMALINLLSLILITPIVSFYILRDWDNITARFDRLLPRHHAPVIREQLHIINNTLAGFIHGQVNVCLLMAVFYGAGLTLAGLNFGIVIGIATGLLVIVPYVGFMLCFIIGMGAAFFQFDNMHDIAVVLGVFVAGQVIESNWLTPKLVGEKVGLHPVWVIFGMLAGAALFGFVGIFLAVPATAIIGVLLRFALTRYMDSSYYQGEAAKHKR